MPASQFLWCAIQLSFNWLKLASRGKRDDQATIGQLSSMHATRENERKEESKSREKRETEI